MFDAREWRHCLYRPARYKLDWTEEGEGDIPTIYLQQSRGYVSSAHSDWDSKTTYHVD